MTGRTGWVCHELYMWHDTLNWCQFFEPGLTIQPGEHAENPETKRRFRNLVEACGMIDHLAPIRPRPAEEEELLRFHTRAHLDHLRAVAEAGGGDAGDLTPMGRGSFEIARLAAGGAIEAAEAVLTGRVENAYALCRPPGHHALPERAMGFCLFGISRLRSSMRARFTGCGGRRWWTGTCITATEPKRPSGRTRTS